ncbi:ribosomal protein S18 acetylase RimI-like enzyme [Mitsuaria sp. BK045]|uniref:GNAT family N-acetyltransferase n=1 Tax=unclassified Roseateles TaxID=2626991 RepID=UPI00161E27F3|nr:MULTISPECIES: GNAT family N-acetyltransferase [unclassified Roseateles]MBB3296193.1 ribosomal protein S18 acetylase RimI-like enzyme [Mitsuaria sp. BK041]MBB3365408.1 ribosomal protein S18 acetylase RimI-like enzyme [Mitsuaria sp. BK045]
MTASPSDPTSTSAPRFAFVRGDEIAPQALHAAFTAAFSDYLIGPFQIPPAQWPMFLARQGVDLALSRVALDPAGAALAFAFVAPRPLAGRWRLATMGALPAARGTGAAPALLDDFIARAAAAGLRAVELEVFAQNERARRLYEGRGFSARHRLDGYTAEPGMIATAPPQGRAAPHAVEMPVALAWLEAAEQRLPELPLQVTAATLRHGVDYHAWQVGASGDGEAPGGDAAAQVVFSLPDETVMVHSLVAPREADARALVQALVAVHPQRRLRVPQLQRDDLGGAALRALGAVPQPLHQQWMLRPL